MKGISILTPAFLAIAFLTVLTIAHLLIGLHVPLHPDEAYYWTWSRDLAPSYYDQGPGIAFYIRLFTQLLGDTHLALKLAAALAGTASTALVYPMARRMGLSSMSALVSTVVYALLPGIWGASLLILHDSVLMLCWNGALLLAMILLDRLRNSEAIGVPLFGLVALMAGGVLTKHTMALLFLAILIWWALSGRYGRLFRDPKLFIASGIGAILVSPLIYWNLNHDFAGVEAILFLRSSGGGMSSSPSTGSLILSQMVALSPVVFVSLLIAAFIGARNLSRSSDRSAKGRLIAWRAIPDEQSLAVLVTIIVFLFFLVFSFRRVVQGNWLFPAYSTAAILFVQMVEGLAREFKRLARFLMVAFLAFSLALIALTLPCLPEPIASHLPLSMSEEQRIGGFAEAVQAVEQLRQNRAPRAHLLATRYQDAAIASYYLPGQPFISSLNILMKNQYSFWPSPNVGDDFVVFLIEDIEGTPGPDFLSATLASLFETVESEHSGTITIHNRKAKRWKAYVARSFMGFPDDAMAEMMRSQMILLMMPSLLEPEEDGANSFDKTSKTLMDVLSSEKQRKAD